MLAILLSLKTMELLQIGIVTHLRVTTLFSMRAVSLASSQSCRSIDADAWFKQTIIPPDTHPSHSECMMIGSNIVRVVMDVNNSNVFIHNYNCTDNEMLVSSILHVTNWSASIKPRIKTCLIFTFSRDINYRRTSLARPLIYTAAYPFRLPV